MADKSAINKLNQARNLMAQMRSELLAIADSAEKNATNVGEVKVARTLRTLADDYRYARNQINKVV